MNNRFIIKYCNILDSVFVLDTLKRMPLTRIHDELSVHGLDCMDMERANEVQQYYENLFGYQRPLFQEVTSFTIKSERWLGNPDYGMEYSIFDNNNKHVLSSLDEDIILKFKEWLENELKYPKNFFHD